MNLSYNWLKEYVDIEMLGLPVETLSEALTSVGLVVESIEPQKNDYLLDIDITTNRSDCLNHLGVAREIAAHFRLQLNKPDFTQPEGDQAGNQFPASVRIEEARLCPRYAARVITGFEIGPSPEWLSRRLESIGQRPINNLVDITNYVLFAVGHPLHAFDYDELEQATIVVRLARPGERLVTLDGKSRELDPSMLVICDAENPVAVAGVMGGAESEIGQATRTLLLESAYFDPLSVRKTAKQLDLRTEASYRFERGADPEMPVRALNLASRLIEEVARGRCVGEVIDENPQPHQRVPLVLRRKRIQQIAGIDIPSAEVKETLQRLEFEVRDWEDGWHVTVPGLRTDVGIEDDLVEEAVRHHGYEKIKSQYPSPAQAGRRDPAERKRRAVEELLKGLGFYEAYNSVFTKPEEEEQFSVNLDRLLALQNPLSEVDSHLRMSLLPGMVRVLRHNLNYGVEDVRLFEIGHVFYEQEGDQKGEKECLGIVMYGNFYESFWSPESEEVHFLHLKGVAESVGHRLGVTLQFKKARVTGFHPGRTASIHLDGKKLGVLGELHPDLCSRYKFSGRPQAAEIFLEQIPTSTDAAKVFSSLNRFPSVERDLSFKIDKNVEFGRIVSAVHSLELIELKSFRLIDFYRGSHLPEDIVSLTVRLVFSHSDRTLTQEEVGELTEQVVTELRERFDIELRS